MSPIFVKKTVTLTNFYGKSIVVINDLRFKGRRSVDWNIFENCLKEYIGQYTEITETSDVVYIGADFPDEFAHSKDTKELRGANMYAKANSSSVIREMIEIATNKTFVENYAQKHNTDAKFGCVSIHKSTSARVLRIDEWVGYSLEYLTAQLEIFSKIWCAPIPLF